MNSSISVIVERDIVIYGSTPAAISAAVQAKRMGASCVIVSPENRIGGLTTGGLGQTDIGNKYAFGGIALEFYRDVAKWYSDSSHWTRRGKNDYIPDGQCSGTKGIDSMWTFEPSAALAILENWEHRDGIEIHRGKLLNRSAGKVRVEGSGEGKKIVSFETLDGAAYKGKVFIDATYEGDLMAAAGVSYTFGREDNSQYGETVSGCQRLQGWHHIEKGVSAYVKEGDPSSGLLPGIERDDGRPDGTGDKYVQAYCFRMCLTDDPENRIPFAKPENYDESNYELLFRNMAAKPKDAFTGDISWKLPWINSKMPNRKTDTNNRDGVSSDFIGQNWNWPEASYEEREKILRAHLEYQRGLMWTLANHPRIPEPVRREYSRWGTCRDEFTDGFGDGWQRQLYVREARRMVGEYVMTEANCRGTKVAPRPVAMAAYGMDSHHVRRIADANGFVHNEGDVEVHFDDCGNRYPPYPVDYGALLPKKSECTNLLVPVCVSASHIAFGSIRMEPVFFALGQAAGTAAAQAVAANVPVQDIAYGTLAERLVKDGQVIGKGQFPVVDALASIMPLGIGANPDVAAVANLLKSVKSTSGIRRFALHAPGHSVRINGCYDTEGYRKVGRNIKAIQDLVESDDIEVGFIMGPTMNAGCNLPWRKEVRADGTESEFRPCPGDPDFQRDFAEHCAAVASECHPFLYMMEDDYRYFIAGCMCEDHLARFGKITGRTWDRETLRKELAKTENSALRIQWDDFLMEDLYEISRQAEKAIHAVSPSTRIALSVSGALRTERAAKLEKVLAGPMRPFCRWQGAIYGYDQPMQLAETLYIPIWARANCSDGIESFYEADNCPRTEYYGSSAQLIAMCSTVLSCGYDGLWFWESDVPTKGAGIPERKHNLIAYAKNNSRLSKIRQEGKAGNAVGVSVPCNTVVQLAWPFGATQNGRICDRAGWARFFGHVGLPYSAKTGNVSCYSGFWAFDGMTDNEIEKILSGNVFLDGEAAEVLSSRGYSKLIGVESCRRERIDFTCERVVKSGLIIRSTFHQNYGLDGSSVSMLKDCGAEPVSVYLTAQDGKVVQSSITRFTNAKGGRIAVMALDLAIAKATNLYNDSKRELLIEVFKWLGGEDVFPARTDNDVLIFLTANEDAAKSRLFIHALSLSADMRESLSFVVSEHYRGGKVEILNGDKWCVADGVWNDNRLTVKTTMHIDDTIALRIHEHNENDN